MTPAERAVIRAARSWAHVEDSDAAEDAAEALQDAVTALESETVPEIIEQTRPWSEVVTEDKIYSTKNARWYRVLSTGPGLGSGNIKIVCEGAAKPFTVPAVGQVLVRRSEMGRAVDVWMGIEIMRSGPA